MEHRSSRAYHSVVRQQTAEATRARVLDAARDLFVRHGIDGVTIAQVARDADVATSTIYAVYKSKEGLLHELMSATLFGPGFKVAQAALEGVKDPVRRVALSARIARAIYDAESAELGLLRGASAFSPALRELERKFEAVRFDMQEERVRRLFQEQRQKPGLTLEEARRVLWMYTSRDVYRMLVIEGGWSSGRYEEWLEQTLIDTLVAR